MRRGGGDQGVGYQTAEEDADGVGTFASTQSILIRRHSTSSPSGGPSYLSVSDSSYDRVSNGSDTDSDDRSRSSASSQQSSGSSVESAQSETSYLERDKKVPLFKSSPKTVDEVVLEVYDLYIWHSFVGVPVSGRLANAPTVSLQVEVG